MPELPEVETVVKALDRVLRGRRMAGAEALGRLRLPFDADEASRLLAGKEILSVRRRAKYILFDFPGRLALLAHLGMTGSFRVERADVPRRRHDRVVFRLVRGDELRFADTRRFGFVKPVELPSPGGIPGELARLGPEPLERGFSGKTLLERAAGRKTPIKVLIMDQEAVVGVGNIYASEALHAAGIDPRRPAAGVSAAEWARTAREIKAILRKAIAKGGSTIRSYRTVDGGEGSFQRSLQVYGRAGAACPRCGATVEAVRLGGRSTFFCPACQA